MSNLFEPAGDYVPLDLNAFANASTEILGDSASLRSGPQVLHGLPFLMCSDPAACLLAFGGGFGSRTLRIPLDSCANTVIVAHRLVAGGWDIGDPVATYEFRFSDGHRDTASIRARFEIGQVFSPHELVDPGIAGWGHDPFLARSDMAPQLPPRWEGPWGLAGYRQSGVRWGDNDADPSDRRFGWTQPQRGPRDYYLWTWTNQRPDVGLESLVVSPHGPLFAIGALTLGMVAEHPFRAAPLVPIRVDLEDPEDAARPFDLSVEIDRGTSTFAYPLAHPTPEAFLGAPFAGFGVEDNRSSSPAYARVAAIPSATVRIRQGPKVLGTWRWKDLERTETLRTGQLRIRVSENGRTWVRTRVVDEATGSPLPCRIHLRSPDGVPYQPHGHHAHINDDLSTWHQDVGGDVRLGGVTYAYINGSCEGWLPHGEVLVDVARGFEYEPLRARVEISRDQRHLELKLRRWRDLNGEGWYSGDTHVHFLSTQGSLLEAQGEDLNVVNLLLAQWGQLFTNVEDFVGRPEVSADGNTVVYASQENRQHILGHLTLLGLTDLISPWSTDGPAEAGLGSGLETTLARWADACHRQGGHVVLPHFPVPNGEPATLIATGRADAVEFHVPSKYSHEEYYRYLNAGYRLPLVGGTDKMTAETPVGLCRTYAHLGDEEFSYGAWCRAMASGRTYLSSGPLLDFSVDGRMVGDTVSVRKGGTVEAHAVAESIFPMNTLQLIARGEVIAAAESSQGARRLELRERVRIERDGWLAVRAGGPEYLGSHTHHDLWKRMIVAHTSPIYITVGEEWEMFDPATVRYMLTLVHGSLNYVRERSHHLRVPEHHRKEAEQLEYLDGPFLEAIDVLHRRLHRYGIPH